MYNHPFISRKKDLINLSNHETDLLENREHLPIRVSPSFKRKKKAIIEKKLVS